MRRVREAVIALVVVFLGLASGPWARGAGAAVVEPPRDPDLRQVERGRYLSKIGGCNDCHTPGYLLAEGKVPETLWLTGDRFGWRGPWGTTYGRTCGCCSSP